MTLDEALDLARRHHQAGNLLLAERTYRDILLAIPHHEDSLHFLGIVLFQRGNIAEALLYLERAAKARAKDPVILTNYGAVLCEAGQFEKSLPIFDKAAKADPSYAESFSNRAHALWMLGRYKDAERAAQRATSLAPRHVNALINLGNALVSQKKYDAAQIAWKKVLKLDPKNSKALNNIGNALREGGKIKESEKYCRRAIDSNENNAEAWNNLANALIDQGKVREAEEAYRRAISLRPDYAHAHNNMAIALTYLQRYDDALTAIRYAVSFRPDYAEGWSNMSVIQRELGNYDDSETAARRAIVLEPHEADYYLDLADVLFVQERLDEAEAALDAALDLAPDSRCTYQKLSNVLERLNRTDEALKAIEKAIKLSPEMPELWVRKAQICHVANRMDDARKAVDAALAIKKDHPAAICMLAEIEQTMGDMKQSEATLRRALAIDENLPALYFSLGKVHKFKRKGDPAFKKLITLSEHVGRMGKAQASTLEFALFSAYEDVCDYKEAFAHLKRGNDLKRETIPFDIEQIRQNHNAIEKMATKKHLKELEGHGYKSALPVFIVGMPRSGTTLTEQIIAAHPQAFGAGELPYFNEAVKDAGIITPKTIGKIGKDYIAQIKKLAPAGTKRITDKMPGNYIRLPEIMLALPDAKIIHCRRDPIDTCLSCYKQLFARGQYWSYDLEELAEQYKAYDQMMQRWREILPPNRLLEIDYEKTVNDFENQARRIIDFIGLPWDKACLTPHKQKRAVLTASKAQVIKPVYTSSVKGWKRYEKELQPLIKALRKKKK